MEAFKRQSGPNSQGPSQQSVLQDDSSVLRIQDNRLQNAVPSGVSTRVSHVTPGPIDQGTSSLAKQEIRSVSGTKRCSSASDDTEEINPERGSGASSLNTRTKKTKVQEAAKCTVPPKKRAQVPRVYDDDDEDDMESVALPPKSIGSGTLIPSSGRIPAWKLFGASIGPDALVLSPPSKKTGPRKADKGADIPQRKLRGPIIDIDEFSP
jgi:hypothetical protein